MAFAGGGLNAPSARDASPGGRFFVFAVLSLVLMYFDQKDNWGERIRYVLEAVAYPIQWTIGLPARLWTDAGDLLQTRGSLQEQNAALIEKDRELTLRTMRFEALEQENARLRGLTGSLPPLVLKSQLADVVNADLGRLRQRLIVNKGDRSGLFRSQSVVDASGLVGQLVRVGPWSAEVMLITDPEAAVPVELVRSGERTIAVGTGDAHQLQLPYLPATADVKEGDLIVTSGLGGVFPAGLPVGKVSESRRDPDDILLHVQVAPSATLDRSRQLVALWFDPNHPAAPPSHEMLDLPAAPVADPVTVEPVPAKPAATTTEKKPAPPMPVGPHPALTRPAAPASTPAAAPTATESAPPPESPPATPAPEVR